MTKYILFILTFCITCNYTEAQPITEKKSLNVSVFMLFPQKEQRTIAKEYWITFYIANKTYFSIEYGPAGYPLNNAVSLGPIKDIKFSHNDGIVFLKPKDPYYCRQLVLWTANEDAFMCIDWHKDHIDYFRFNMDTFYKILEFIFLYIYK